LLAVANGGLRLYAVKLSGRSRRENPKYRFNIGYEVERLAV
jgi:hypothetical protein